MGRRTDRTDLGREFRATHVVAERGEEGMAEVREITGGEGTHVVLEAVGHVPADEQAVAIVRPGGTVSRVGVPQDDEAPVGFTSVWGRNAALTGGPARCGPTSRRCCRRCWTGPSTRGASSTGPCRWRTPPRPTG